MRVILDLETLQKMDNVIVYVLFNYKNHWYDFLELHEKRIPVVKVYANSQELLEYLGVTGNNYDFQKPILVWIINNKPVCYIQNAKLQTIYAITNNYIN